MFRIKLLVLIGEMVAKLYNSIRAKIVDIKAHPENKDKDIKELVKEVEDDVNVIL